MNKPRVGDKLIVIKVGHSQYSDWVGLSGTIYHIHDDVNSFSSWNYVMSSEKTKIERMSVNLPGERIQDFVAVAVSANISQHKIGKFYE